MTASTHHAFDFTYLPSGASQPTTLIDIRDSGSLDLINNSLLNAKHLSPTTMLGSLDLGGYNLNNVGTLSGTGTATLQIGGNVESLSIQGTPPASGPSGDPLAVFGAAGAVGTGSAAGSGGGHIYLYAGDGGAAMGTGPGGTGGNVWIYAGYGGSANGGGQSGTGGTVYISPGLSWGSNGAVGAVLLAPQGGNVGVGPISAPAYPLDIAGSQGTGYGQGTLRVSGSNGDVQIHLLNTSSGGRDYALDSAGYSSGLGAGNFLINDATAGLFRLAIDPNGNVGIGAWPNGNGGSSLTVAGATYANSLLFVGTLLQVGGTTAPNIPSQGAYLGWNALSGGTGETDFINQRGTGGGGFAFFDLNAGQYSAPLPTPLMQITGAALGGQLKLNGTLIADGTGCYYA